MILRIGGETITKKRLPSAMFLAGLALVGAFGMTLAGCKSDAQFSQKEMQQLKEGPPKEMPPQARKMFEEAAKAGAGKPSTPPPASGQ